MYSILKMSTILRLAFLHQLISLMVTEAAAADLGCIERSFGHTSHVCVCNSTYCDTLSIPDIEANTILHIESDREGKRFAQSTVEWGEGDETVGVLVNVDSSRLYQTILGFGGAFTDAAGINIAKLSKEAQENLIRYLKKLRFTALPLKRKNVTPLDKFLIRPLILLFREYTYCDTPGDTELSTFNLTVDDTLYKIPYINQAKQISNKQIKMFASPWSAPAWMKSNNALNGQGYLLPEYYSAWANYFIKFLDSYKELGVEFWGLTAQNEPYDGDIPDFSFNCMGWNASTQVTGVTTYFPVTSFKCEYADVILMALDDQRPFIRAWAETVMENPKAAQFVSGWAVHWYVDFLGFLVSENFRKVIFLGTKGCEKAVFKNPMYYAMGHFSKFMTEGSVRIGVDTQGYDADRVQMVGVKRPDGATVLVITNKHLESAVKVRIEDGAMSSQILTIQPESVHTLVWFSTQD
ncbi:glucosylceramidase [Eurytemora carolleeae]|uniref:glucosylceramidase n=1 Tax=Eurytemora carolleeae TaxID=1294199 RepID=UPI000C768398|nr:glucosylceramidase [Eurytemora carolleeae]|eukprot:XP_023343121.1 glucosylceramidase-like [Eurytemora affinis]